MALIPPDAGIQLRMQTEANFLHPVAPAKGLPSDLPELRKGQVFTAQIQEALPENTYKALVAGKSLTLSLPEGAKPGDTLELVVVDRTAKAILAQPKEPLQGTSTPYPHATVSKAGQMIAQLLPREGEPPQPAPLARGQPLLPAPPQSASQLAPALAQAVSQSGLFYESHQAKWVAGRLPTNALLREPQGQQPASSPLQENPAGLTQEKASLPARAPVQMLPGAEQEPQAERAAGPLQQAGAATARAVPEELRPLVQQQLDAVATQRLVWHGEAWPGQPMDWEIEWERGQRETASEDEASAWRTTLRLSTPHLGTVDARIRLTPAGIDIGLSTPSEASANALQADASSLADAMSAAGLTLLALKVRHEPG